MDRRSSRSTAPKSRVTVRWRMHRPDGAKRRIRRAVPFAVNEAALEVRAAEIAGGKNDGAAVPPDFLGPIPADREISSVAAGKARDTGSCRRAVADCGARAAILRRQDGNP